MIYQIKNNAVIKSYDASSFGDHGVSHIFNDSYGNIWFSLMNNGFYFIAKGSDKITDLGSTMGLQKTLVNDYMEEYCPNRMFRAHDG